jgi:hypothetical protein
MKKEFLKGFTMIALIVALALATAAATNAQSTNKVVGHVPFEFSVGDQSMPAGDYAVKPATSNGNALMIQNDDARISAIRLSNSVQSRTDKGRARLVFHRYGENYFLAEVWTGSGAEGRQLLKSRRERAIERELASITPSNGTDAGYETVVVLATNR